MEFSRFDIVSFDCYGTLIDWETGIWDALRPVLARHGITADRERALELFGAVESHVQRGPYQTYRAVLRRVMEQMAAELEFVPSPGEADALATSLKHWPAFPDTAPALAALAQRYRLAVISNVDDDLFAGSAPKLGVPLDWLVTAEQVGAYKPSSRNFEVALGRFGVSSDRVLHVAQSLYHDVGPARALGLSTVWVNRRRGQAGAGATPAAEARPDLEVPDLRTLVEAMDLVGG